MCMSALLAVMYVYRMQTWYLWRPENVVRSPGTSVRGKAVRHHLVLGIKTGSSVHARRAVLLTTEQPCQPLLVNSCCTQRESSPSHLSYRVSWFTHPLILEWLLTVTKTFLLAVEKACQVLGDTQIPRAAVKWCVAGTYTKVGRSGPPGMWRVLPEQGAGARSPVRNPLQGKCLQNWKKLKGAIY